MDVRHGFLECYPGCWIRIDAIHTVCAASDRDRRYGAESAIYAGAANIEAGGGVLCAIPVDDVLAAVERYGHRPGLVPAAIPDEGGETAAARRVAQLWERPRVGQ